MLSSRFDEVELVSIVEKTPGSVVFVSGKIGARVDCLPPTLANRLDVTAGLLLSELKTIGGAKTMLLSALFSKVDWNRLSEASEVCCAIRVPTNPVTAKLDEVSVLLLRHAASKLLNLAELKLELFLAPDNTFAEKTDWLLPLSGN